MSDHEVHSSSVCISLGRRTIKYLSELWPAVYRYVTIIMCLSSEIHCRRCESLTDFLILIHVTFFNSQTICQNILISQSSPSSRDCDFIPSYIIISVQNYNMMTDLRVSSLHCGLARKPQNSFTSKSEFLLWFSSRSLRWEGLDLRAEPRWGQTIPRK